MGSRKKISLTPFQIELIPDTNHVQSCLCMFMWGRVEITDIIFSQLTISWRSKSNVAHPGSPKTKLCRLVGSGILYMDHPQKTSHGLFGRLDFLPATCCFSAYFPSRTTGQNDGHSPTYKAWKIISRRRLREVLGDDALGQRVGVLEGGLQ